MVTLFGNKEWNDAHVLHWSKYLELDVSGFSVFQKELSSKLQDLLANFEIAYQTELSEHFDGNEGDRMVKILLITSGQNLKCWIYHDMADLEINKQHKVFEEWGYLKPDDLIRDYLKETRELVRLHS